MDKTDKNYLINKLYGIKGDVNLGRTEIATKEIDKLIKEIERDY